ncbi:helix-turn-helix domain-containing protein [Alkalicoccobacillus gibsonii]|uniref:helix-turn-helix domain-containing protein n=1 Tax=Alkalicoccobacillus gibsonii TaxID=79881 RepID=UPI00351439C1
MQNLGIFNTLSEFVLIRINLASEITHFKGWIESKKHLDYDLWYIENGEMELQVGDKTFIVKEKDMVLFGPRIAYTATVISKSCSFHFIHFDFSLGEHSRILDHYDLTGIISPDIAEEERELLLGAYSAYKTNVPLSAIRLKGSLTILLSKIIESYGAGKYRGAFNESLDDLQKSSNPITNLQPVFSYIQEHYSKSIRIQDLAELVGISEKYFISYFKQAFGVTPGRYIYQFKMNEARKLLLSKKYSIQEIASMLGYSDPFSFSKSFKKYYTISPSDFC